MLVVKNSRSLFTQIQEWSLLMAEIVRRQSKDLDLKKILEKLSQGQEANYVVREDGALTKEGRLRIPNIKELKDVVLEEVYSLTYVM